MSRPSIIPAGARPGCCVTISDPENANAGRTGNVMARKAVRKARDARTGGDIDPEILEKTNWN